MQAMGGTIRLFKFSGIQVYLHFSWFLIAAYQLTQFKGVYDSPIWAVMEYLALFAIVLLHEFGHALACRQTGGEANQIVLWPLGGIAFVSPPRRPGAVLWSIAAGPLVNVVLLPLLSLALVVLGIDPLDFSGLSDLPRFVGHVWRINLGLLIFNMLPVYPLDGGQILRALLWFPLGEIRSLRIASVVGLIGGACMALFAVWNWSFWLGILAFFIFSRAIAGWQYSKALVEEEKANRAAALVPTIPESERPGL
jgi:Zn-dependent protease